MRLMCMDSALGKEDLGLGTVFCSGSVGFLHLDLFLREESYAQLVRNQGEANLMVAKSF